MKNKITITIPSGNDISFETKDVNANQYSIVFEEPNPNLPGIVLKRTWGEPILVITGNMPEPLRKAVDKIIKEYCNH